MRRLILVLIVVLLLSGVSACGKKAEPEVSVQEAAASTAAIDSTVIPVADDAVISTEDIVVALTGMPNRFTGSDNNKKAYQFIAKQYEQLGLQPLVKESYYWPYQQNVDGLLIDSNNVVGYLSGTDHKQAIIISCHLDSVDGSKGAVDNASGVAAMLYTANRLIEHSDELEADIIFCAFNGEEQNYAGSEAFVKEFEGMYERVCNINYDCVGVIDGGEYMFGVTESDVGYGLNMAVRSYLDKSEIPYGEYPVKGVRSDHVSFEFAQIPNINFTQIGISQFTHSSKDTMEQLDMEQITLIADCVTEFLLSGKS